MPVGEDCGGIKWPWREGWWNKLPLGRGDSDEIKYPWGEGWRSWAKILWERGMLLVE